MFFSKLGIEKLNALSMLTVLLVPIFEILCPVAKKAMTFSIILMKNIYLNFDLPVQNKLLTNMMFIESRFFFFCFCVFYRWITTIRCFLGN